MENNAIVTDGMGANSPAVVSEAAAATGSETVKLIVAGVGNWGGVLMRESHKLGALVAITDCHRRKMESSYSDIGSPASVTMHDTLEDALRAYPKAAVVIATPPSSHYDMALIAIEAGRDVWVEKPICSKASQAADLVARAEKYGTILFVDHLLRYSYAHRIVLKLVREGWVGDVTRVRTIRLNFGTVRTVENALWSFGPHDVSLVLALCKDESPTAVTAVGQATVSTGIHDYVELMLQFNSGVHAHISTSWLHYEKERRLTVYGKKGCLIVNEYPGGSEDKPRIEGYKWSAKLDEEDGGDVPPVKISMTEQDLMEEYATSAHKTPVENALEHFLECCRMHKTPETCGKEGERVLNVLTAADQSLQDKCTIFMGESDNEIGNENGQNVQMEGVALPSKKAEPVSDDGFKTEKAAQPRKEGTPFLADQFNANKLEQVALETKEIEPISAGGSERKLGEMAHPNRRFPDEKLNEIVGLQPQAIAAQNPVIMQVQVAQPELDESEFKAEEEGAAPRDLESDGENKATVDTDMDMVSEPSGPAPPARDYFVHDSATVDYGATVGTGTKIWHFSHVMSGARIGKECNLGQNIYVGGKVVIGDRVKVQNGVSIYDGVEIASDAFLGPHCTFTNVKTPRSFINRRGEYAETKVGRGATIGANATIICGNKIGEFSLVGAGAVVTHDVPKHACVMGNPAELRYWVSETGAKLEEVAHNTDLRQGECVMRCTETKVLYSKFGTGICANLEKHAQ